MTYMDFMGPNGNVEDVVTLQLDLANLGKHVVNKEWPDLHEQNGPCIWFPVVSGQIHIDMTYSVNQAK